MRFSPLANRADVVAAKQGMHGLAKAVRCGGTANSITPGWLHINGGEFMV